MTGGAVLEASHSVPGCGCSWVSRSGQGAGPEAVGAGSPQRLGHRSEGWAVHRCHCLSVAGGGAASGCPRAERAAWGGTLREGLSSPHSCSPGGSLGGWAGPGWWRRGFRCSGKPGWPPAPPQRWALCWRTGLGLHGCRNWGCSFGPGGRYPCPEALVGAPGGASSQQAGCCGYPGHAHPLAARGPGG